MKTIFALAGGVGVALALAGCVSLPPGAEPGPHGTMAYDVLIEASEPGARIEANGAYVGTTPVHLKLFADPDGTFHDFGAYYYVIKASPLTTNQHLQVRYFRTGRSFTPEDQVPQQIYFDMSQPTPPSPPPDPPSYGYPYYPYYYGPPPAYFYGPAYYGPAFRFYVGPGYHHHW